MGKTTEGIMLTSSIKAEVGKYAVEVDPPFFFTNSEVQETLLKISRQQFVDDVKQALGDIEETLPPDVKRVLEKVIDSTQLYLQLGQDIAFLALCFEALKKTGQGWGYLSYWVSSEQSRCYSIYWRLKNAVEKHQKRMKMFKHPKNDGVPPNDASMPILPPDPKVASLHEQCIQKTLTQNHFIRLLGSTAKRVHERLLRKYHSKGLENFKELFEIKTGWTHNPYPKGLENKNN